MLDTFQLPNLAPIIKRTEIHFDTDFNLGPLLDIKKYFIGYMAYNKW
jgi:hypothetical protein